MASSMKLLAVSWAMPPMLYPRSIQVARILGALRQFGWDSVVVCSDAKESHSLDVSLLERYGACYQAVPTPLEDSNQKDDALMSKWLAPAVRETKRQISTQKYSALITFAQPWVDHLVGLQVRSSHLPWIAHFSDPWVDSQYYAGCESGQKAQWRKMEHSVIQYADLVLFTNSQALELVMGKYPRRWRTKARVIPHAFDENIMQEMKIIPTPRGRLKLTYTGDLYRGRSAEFFFKALARLSQERPLAKELLVKLVGRIDENEVQISNVLGLQGIVEFFPQLPYTQSLQMCAQSDILFLIDAPSSTSSPFLPSKLVDYLAFRKPLFALTSNSGASADLLRQLGFFTTPPDNVEAIVAALRALLDSWKSANLNIPIQYEKVAAMYASSQVAEQFHRILQDSVLLRSRPWWKAWRI